MKVTAAEYLDARGSAEYGTLVSGFLAEELLGQVHYDPLTRLIEVSPLATRITARLFGKHN